MYDTNFIRSAKRTRRCIVNDVVGLPDDPRDLAENLDEYRSRIPHIFNIETTNACNMTCKMCPRTTMKRPVKHVDMDLFKRVIDQCRVPDPKSLEDFNQYVQRTHGIKAGDKTEDAFYFYVSSRFLTMHGYGDPLCDPHIVDRVQYCTDRGVPTYFSTVPVNAKPDKVEALMGAGLGVLKFSMDATGPNGVVNYDAAAASNIDRVIHARDKGGYRTQIAIITLDDGDIDREYFAEMWRDQPVMAYIKSMDNRWHAKDIDAPDNQSHYVKQYCEYPWTSMTVMSNGKVVPCPQDYDCEMVMGDAAVDSLEAIWNGERYAAFREAHVTGKGCLKCFDRCDQKVVADWRE